jgi:hypothetical protein
MPYEFEITQDLARWDAFLLGSAQQNIFSSSAVLGVLDARPEFALMGEGGRLLMGAVILKDASGAVLSMPRPLCLYQGLYFCREWAGYPPHRKAAATVEWTGAFLAYLCAAYPRLSFCLHPAFNDLRPLQWIHYHEPAEGLFHIEVRYTGWIDLPEGLDFDTYLAGIRPTRRNEYRKGLKLGLQVAVSQDLDLLDDLHGRTFARQEVERSVEERRTLRALAGRALATGQAEMLVCSTAEGRPASVTMFLRDAQSAYYWVGANDPDLRNTCSGVFLFLENIRRCLERGVRRVDTVGINSPQRGDFKTSFNARPVPYFVVNWSNT